MAQIGIENIFHISQIGPDFGMVGDTTFFKSEAKEAVFRRQGKMFIKLDPTNYPDLYTQAGIEPGEEPEPEEPETPPVTPPVDEEDDPSGTP